MSFLYSDNKKYRHDIKSHPLKIDKEYLTNEYEYIKNYYLQKSDIDIQLEKRKIISEMESLNNRMLIFSSSDIVALILAVIIGGIFQIFDYFLGYGLTKSFVPLSYVILAILILLINKKVNRRREKRVFNMQRKYIMCIKALDEMEIREKDKIFS